MMKKLLFIVLGLASLNVYANCPGRYFPDTGICQIQGNNGEIINYNVSAPQSGRGRSSQQPEVVNIDVPSKYGAWAVNLKTGISAGALNMDSREAAEKLAVKTCEQDGRNAPCVIGTWVRNGCIAVAQGKSGKKLKTFYGHGPHPGQAEPSALRQCQTSGATQCKITTPEGCSLPVY